MNDLNSHNRFGLPHLGYGIGLRPPHYAQILSEWPAIDWFEIISENFLGDGGRPLSVLDRVAARYPMVMHGVSMNIGSVDPIDLDYLGRIKQLASRIDARWVSDHLCWTGVQGQNSHDLLPVPYSEAMLRHVVERIRTVQDVLERPVLFENPSSYVEFRDSAMPEVEFIGRMADEADCGLLLDVNNVYVSCFNHGWDADQYLAEVPYDRVVQIHLAGHTHKGTHLLDTHSDHVIDEVWQLYRQVHDRSGGRATMVEWDDQIPDFDVVHAEVLKARRLVSGRPAIDQESAHVLTV
ncbi:MAG: DUF692 domain-containing protein [Deltaproteobacteria bacterium]|jgi:uncharacterized protein (UPF0276 family)|nr:DUF692 domain-containing protein [Deltaproteobacteria bacterium]MBW2530744.1 DUF692 domain-containing protein [Deltaproteobacteria bacterium]